MHPVFTVVLAALLLGERIGRGCWLGVPLALAGVLLGGAPGLPVRRRFRAPLDAFAVAVALAGAFFSADAYVTVRHLARTGEHPLAIVFSFPAVAAVLSLPLMLRDFVWPSAPSGSGCSSRAARRSSARSPSRAASSACPPRARPPYSYTQVVFAAALGALPVRRDAGRLARRGRRAGGGGRVARGAGRGRLGQVART